MLKFTVHELKMISNAVAFAACFYLEKALSDTEDAETKKMI